MTPVGAKDTLPSTPYSHEGWTRVEDLITELAALEKRAVEGAAPLLEDKTKQALQRIVEAAHEFGRSWSGSWIGYQANVYYAGFQPRPRGAVFSIEWGLMETAFGGYTESDWEEYPFDAVIEAVLAKAGNPDLEALS